MLVGITGHARHGKDSTADFLVKRFGFRKIALADNMKRACKIIFPNWSDEYLWGDHKDDIDPVWGISARHALQELGTGFGQHALGKYDSFAKTTGRLLWTRSTLSGIGEHENVVISDVRFPHEAEEIRRRGGKIIRVFRTIYPVDESHESEKAVMQIEPDCTIVNDGTLEELELMAVRAIHGLARIGLDIDDVLADFCGEYCKRYGLERPKTWRFDPLFSERYAELCNDESFFLDMPALESMDKLRFEPVCYITSRACPKEWTERWLAKNGFPPAPVYCPGPDASKVDIAKAERLDIFVDDRFDNFVELTRAGVFTYLYSQPHNARYNVGHRRINSLAELF
jgi:hypothetical protein